MEAIAILFFLMVLACLALLLFGMIKPGKVFLGAESTRGKVGKIYGLGLLVSFIVFVVAIPKPSDDETSVSPVTTAQPPGLSSAKEETPSPSMVATPPVPAASAPQPEGQTLSASPGMALLDGEVPEMIRKAMQDMGAKNLRMDVSKGVLTIKLPALDEVKEGYYQAIVRDVIMSRWENPNYDANDASSRLASDVPNWSGIITIRVSNRSGSHGFIYNGGADGFEKGSTGDFSGKKIMERSVAFGKLTQEEKDEIETEICRKDVQCWANKHIRKASLLCADAIENLAQYQSKWTDTWLEEKFHRVSWKDEEKGIVRYWGDRIQFQNGFGAWQPHRYVCEFDTLNNRLIDVGAEPGRL